jgi:hypothetical protein
MKSLEGRLYILVKKLSKYKNKILIVEKFGGEWISKALCSSDSKDIILL